MKSKRIIIIILVILIILLFIILGKILKSKSKENTVIEESQVVRNDNENVTSDDYNKSLYYEKDGTLYTTSGEPADGIDFDIKGIPDEVLKFFSNIEAFYSTVRFYVYSYGLNEKANVATYSRYEYQEDSNRLAIEFILDDSENTKIVFIINIFNNSVEFSY